MKVVRQLLQLGFDENIAVITLCAIQNVAHKSLTAFPGSHPFPNQPWRFVPHVITMAAA